MARLKRLRPDKYGADEEVEVRVRVEEVKDGGK